MPLVFRIGFGVAAFFGVFRGVFLVPLPVEVAGGVMSRMNVKKKVEKRT